MVLNGTYTDKSRDFDLPREVIDTWNFPESPVEWDFVLSCAEPLKAVTGGIGTYSRMLLEALSKYYNKILVFTANEFSKDEIPPGVSVVSIRTTRVKSGRGTHNLSDELLVYSFHLATVLQKFYQDGHRFSFTEFPDYGNDGYFSMCLRKAGSLDLGKVYIRLHSPHFMLRDDNLWPAHLTPLNVIEHGDAERFVMREADGLLYGGVSMLDRVLAYFESNEREVLKEKSFQIPHPWPNYSDKVGTTRLGHPDLIENDIIHLGLIGRLEVRKGTLKMLEMFREPAFFNPIPSIKVRFHFIGASTHDWDGRKIEDIAREQIWSDQQIDNVKFHGKLSQDVLQNYIERLDGVVYPSLFENYPNALLEVLHAGKPVMVSVHGCMPMLTDGYPGAVTFDPFNKDDFLVKYKDFVRHISDDRNDDSLRKNRHHTYKLRSELENAQLCESYKNLPKGSSQDSICPDSVTVSFVLPFFNHARHIGETLMCISLLLRKGDEIIIVDDHSKPEELEHLERVVSQLRAPIRIVAKHQNSGPGAARNDGYKISKCDAIQFLDADDLLDKTGFELAREALNRNNEIDVVFGYQECFGDADHIWVPTRPSHEVSFVRNFAHSAPLIRKSSLERMGGYPAVDIKHYEDWAFNLLMLVEGLNVLILPVATHKYRIERGRSRSTTNISYEHISYQRMIEAVTNAAKKRDRVDIGAAWLRSVGRAWLFERGSAIMSDGSHASNGIDVQDIERKAADRIITSALRAWHGDHEISERVKVLNSRLRKLGRKAQIRLLRKVKYFDADWYVRSNKDLFDLNLSSLEGATHYHDHGYLEGRDPTPYINGLALKRVLSQYVGEDEMANALVLYAKVIEAGRATRSESFVRKSLAASSLNVISKFVRRATQ